MKFYNLWKVLLHNVVVLLSFVPAIFHFSPLQSPLRFIFVFIIIYLCFHLWFISSFCFLFSLSFPNKIFLLILVAIVILLHWASQYCKFVLVLVYCVWSVSHHCCCLGCWFTFEQLILVSLVLIWPKPVIFILFFNRFILWLSH